MADTTVTPKSRDRNICTRCNVWHPRTPDCFQKDGRSPDGLSTICKRCRKKYRRQYYLENKERCRRQNQAWMTENAEAFRSYQRQWQKENAAKQAEYGRQWAKKNPEKLRAKWRRRNERRRTDPALSLHSRVSRGMRKAIGQAKAGRTWESLVGYSLTDLVSHIERQFTKGMSWDRYRAGDIHIDHIVPLASFSIAAAEDEEFRAAWALSNLRPVWAAENQRKHAKREFLL